MEYNILLVDKPSRSTSFDVIRILRDRSEVRKMGHADTLPEPFLSLTPLRLMTSPTNNGKIEKIVRQRFLWYDGIL